MSHKRGDSKSHATDTGTAKAKEAPGKKSPTKPGPKSHAADTGAAKGKKGPEKKIPAKPGSKCQATGTGAAKDKEGPDKKIPAKQGSKCQATGTGAAKGKEGPEKKIAAKPGPKCQATATGAAKVKEGPEKKIPAKPGPKCQATSTGAAKNKEGAEKKSPAKPGSKCQATGTGAGKDKEGPEKKIPAKPGSKSQATSTGVGKDKEGPEKKIPAKPGSKSQATGTGAGKDKEGPEKKNPAKPGSKSHATDLGAAKGKDGQQKKNPAKPGSKSRATHTDTVREKKGLEKKSLARSESESQATDIGSSLGASPLDHRAVSFQERVPECHHDGASQDIDTRSLEEEADSVMSKLGLEALPKPNLEASSFFNAEVRLKEDEKKGVAEAFRPFRERIVSELRDSSSNSGSSYDGTKVTRADEVDCMFHPDLPADWIHVVYKGAPPGFCFVKLKGSSSSSSSQDAQFQELKELCINGFVSSSKFREKVFELFEGSVRKERRARKDPSSKPGSPSYAVLFKATPTDHGLREISIDLVPALHIKSDGLPPKADRNLKRISDTDVERIKKAGFDVIPKECQKADYKHIQHILWRLSFSRAEKELTNHADKRTREDQHGAQVSPPTCRKWVLRMLKRFLEIIKGFQNSRDGSDPVLQGLQKAAHYLKTCRGRNVKIEKFTTFQVRTLLWTEMYVVLIDNDKWTVPTRRTRLIQALGHLKKMVSGQKQVDHFFVPNLNIMAEVPREEREFLYIMFHIISKMF